MTIQIKVLFLIQRSLIEVIIFEPQPFFVNLSLSVESQLFRDLNLSLEESELVDNV